MARVVAEVCRVLGVAVPSRRERKYQVRNNLPALAVSPMAISDIEQRYLQTTEPGVERRIRRVSGVGGPAVGHLFVYSEKRDAPDGGRVSRDRVISASEYILLKSEPTGRSGPPWTIRKRRYSFPWRHQYFKLDCFEEPALEYSILEVETTDEQPEVELPPFLTVEAEVTDHPAFRNAEIARAHHRPTTGVVR
jgi:hypothetical protein